MGREELLFSAITPERRKMLCNSFPADEGKGVDTDSSPPFYGGGTPLVKPILTLPLHSRPVWHCPRREALSTLAYRKDQGASANSILTPWREPRPPENSGCSDGPAASCVTQVHFAPQGNVASGSISKQCLTLTLAMSHLRAAPASSRHEKNP